MGEWFTYRLVVEYDGRPFYGWQRLVGKPTVQGCLEGAVQEAFGERVTVVGAGRTDRGVHALGQVAGFRLTKAHPASTMVEALQARLPPGVRVLELVPTTPDFHARESAVGKVYEYRICERAVIEAERTGRVWHRAGSLKVEDMRAGAIALVGRHDFASFASKTRHRPKSTEREIRRMEVRQREDLVVVTVEGNSFLNHMVRNMVSLLVAVGEGRTGASQVQEILAARRRSASPGTAPAEGLYLIQVQYARLPDSSGQTAEVPS